MIKLFSKKKEQQRRSKVIHSYNASERACNEITDCLGVLHDLAAIDVSERLINALNVLRLTQSQELSQGVNVGGWWMVSTDRSGNFSITDNSKTGK